MANRPRRPTTGGRPETIIDGKAERIGATGGPEDLARPADAERSAVEPGFGTDTVSGADEAVVSGGAAADRTSTPSDAVVETGDAGEAARVHDAVANPAPEGVDRVEPATGAALPAGDDRPAAVETSESPAVEFAREEGFVPEDAVAAEPARQHLGEFEDDETVHPQAEAARTQTTVPDNSPYLAGHSSEPRGGAGFGSLLGAGALGAVIALLLGGTALYGGLIPPPGQQQPVQTQQFAQAGDVQQLRSDLDQVRGVVEQVQSAQAAGGAGSGTVSTAEFTQLTDRVTANERAIQSGGTSTGDAAAAAATANEAATAARDTAARAETAANAARDTANAAQGAADEARQGVSAAQQAAQNAQSAANEARSAIDGFGQRLGAIEEANKRAAVALSAAGLKSAIDRGTPFMSELESFATASGDTGAVAPLRDFAAKGVPTTSALNARWQEAEAAILSAVRPEVSTEDVGTQVLSGLRSLVQVRPAGSSVAPDAPGPQAAVARMDAAVTSGNYATWLAEWDKLPDAAKTASESFAADVRARVEADRLIQDTINRAVGASSQG
ncbi:hypothetical protein [Aureimonas phyllosphaerae]|uniref:Inner membrane protein n=1 Tax=Aureimonas phyllosphaerae TaxID=1166078 RepID=A0A7W6FVG4_9HYPH|nr:hypothetical protein [Aureimonas phyllosphaerae]MBB3936002.1 hypothetical protein [Aureimonas phyllosphaerae]MBB3960273.1 hypothetical protein [Aureimonas phyllosphaerae]SFF35817.1 Uncharacterized conserved protein [Aureimonas phyllosphaerae]